MSYMLKFDDNIIENLRMFSFEDYEQIYTNGAELVPLYRVVQILEHFKVQELVDKATPMKPYKQMMTSCLEGANSNRTAIYQLSCRNCDSTFEENCDDLNCRHCGQALLWKD